MKNYVGKHLIANFDGAQGIGKCKKGDVFTITSQKFVGPIDGVCSDIDGVCSDIEGGWWSWNESCIGSHWTLQEIEEEDQIINIEALIKIEIGL